MIDPRDCNCAICRRYIAAKYKTNNNPRFIDFAAEVLNIDANYQPTEIKKFYESADQTCEEIKELAEEFYIDDSSLISLQKKIGEWLREKREDKKAILHLEIKELYRQLHADTEHNREIGRRV